ncbi:MAG: YbdK family carboxylate-amine ligase [Rhodocyclaceae bacterium]|jgi:carboxylate-amine ligase|nr:YbdK family carboxylate-amine ligase [Rhodocyclaceae bacterium]
MPLEPFAASRSLTLGVELELQLVNLHDYDLTTAASDLLRAVGKRTGAGEIKPEITSSMIEISTGICEGYTDALAQLREIRDALVEAARRLNIGICGGGTHPFQHWGAQRIFDAPRFQHLNDLYGYLAKQFTVFGQHVHIGCPGPDQAFHLLHALSRYIPHFIALAAASPYVQGYDTGFQSARLNSIFAFPLSGRAPFVETWRDFEEYFDQMTATGVVSSMKDFYWDIRPKPEYGTVEVRVMDTPLTIERAAELAAYIQAVARYLMVEQPYAPAEADYLVYTFNRFQACRFGFDGTLVAPKTHEHRTIGADIRETLAHLEPHASELGCDAACRSLGRLVDEGGGDAAWLRKLTEQGATLPEMVRRQCLAWQARDA